MSVRHAAAKTPTIHLPLEAGLTGEGDDVDARVAQRGHRLGAFKERALKKQEQGPGGRGFA